MLCSLSNTRKKDERSSFKKGSYLLLSSCLWCTWCGGEKIWGFEFCFLTQYRCPALCCCIAHEATGNSLLPASPFAFSFRLSPGVSAAPLPHPQTEVLFVLQDQYWGNVRPWKRWPAALLPLFKLRQIVVLASLTELVIFNSLSANPALGIGDLEAMALTGWTAEGKVIMNSRKDTGSSPLLLSWTEYLTWPFLPWFRNFLNLPPTTEFLI